MLLKSEGLGPQQREDVETILQQSARCGKIVKNLLQFSRLKKGAETAVELPAVLDAALQLAGFDLRRALVEVTRDLPPDLPAVSGDASQLQQVFLNLIVNAGHALEGKTGGKLIISAAAAGGAVTLRFQDNGCGIPAENLTRVFDPFFTSKPAGKGTGLGLSMSFGILQQHRGSIRVESEEGKGAAFIITLPVRGEAPDGTV
jgi:signal transduction histidine kinase